MYTAAVADLGKIVQEKKVPIGGGDTTASFFSSNFPALLETL